jgi:hypothetical protein
MISGGELLFFCKQDLVIVGFLCVGLVEGVICVLLKKYLEFFEYP